MISLLTEHLLVKMRLLLWALLEGRQIRYAHLGKVCIARFLRLEINQQEAGQSRATHAHLLN